MKRAYLEFPLSSASCVWRVLWHARVWWPTREGMSVPCRLTAPTRSPQTETLSEPLCQWPNCSLAVNCSQWEWIYSSRTELMRVTSSLRKRKQCSDSETLKATSKSTCWTSQLTLGHPEGTNNHPWRKTKALPWSFCKKWHFSCTCFPVPTTVPLFPSSECLPQESCFSLKLMRIPFTGVWKFKEG